MVNLEIMRQRKAVYGDNIQECADAWSEELGERVTPQMFCKLMARLKEVRIRAINRRWRETGYEPTKDEYDALQDSKTDRNNYLFISNHYEEYKAL